MRWCSVLSCFVCCALNAPRARAEAPEVAPSLRKTVTLDFDNLTLEQCAERLRSIGKLNVIVHESLRPLLDARQKKLELDETGFENPGPSDEPKRQVQLPRGFSCQVRGLSLRSALQVFLDHYGLGYAVVDGSLVIATADKAEAIQREQPVSLNLGATSLSKALEELRDRYDIHIMIDPLAVKDAKTPVTLHADEVALEEALQLLADQVHARAARLGSGWLLTSAEKAREWEARAKRRADPKTRMVKLGPDGNDPNFGMLGGGNGFAGFGMQGGMGGFAGGAWQTLEAPRALLQVAGPAPRGIEKADKPQKPAAAPPARKSLAAETLEKMREPVTFPDPAALPLRQALDFLEERGLPPVTIDRQAFLDESPESPDPGEAKVTPPRSKDLPRARMLRLLLAQAAPTATFLVRPNQILVTTHDGARPNSQFVENVSFVARPLEEALQELSELSGISILVDARVGDKAKTVITARLPSQTNVAQATRMLADMADLKAVIVDTTLYVTSRSNTTSFPEESLSPGKLYKRDAAQ